MSAISIITSLGQGALHALVPGHGKTFLASYTLSNNINTFISELKIEMNN